MQDNKKRKEKTWCEAKTCRDNPFTITQEHNFTSRIYLVGRRRLMERGFILPFANERRSTWIWLDGIMKLMLEERSSNDIQINTVDSWSHQRVGNVFLVLVQKWERAHVLMTFSLPPPPFRTSVLHRTENSPLRTGRLFFKRWWIDD